MAGRSRTTRQNKAADFARKGVIPLSFNQLFAYGGGGLAVLLTVLQLAPIKVNPWSAIARWIGKAINGDVLDKLNKVESRLEKHISADDERDADMHRARILQFNTELLREKKHTEEDFNEIFYNINCYERYCRDHPDYQNGRAVHAIANIGRVYDDRLKKHDFL